MRVWELEVVKLGVVRVGGCETWELWGCEGVRPGSCEGVIGDDSFRGVACPPSF